MVKKKIRTAVAGVGYIAREVHLPLLTRWRDIQVLAICDKDDVELQKVGKQFKIERLYLDFTEMVEKERPDLVDICTPPDTHAALAVQALERGCNCIVEKPMALTTVDADRMIKTAKERGLGLYVVHNYSFTPCVRKAKSMVARGEIGRLVSVEVKYIVSIEKERYFDSSHWCHRFPGDIFSTEITPHLIMLILDFLDSEKAECIQVFKGKISDYPHIQADELRAVIKGEHTIGTLSLSYNSPFNQLSICLVGTNGYIRIDGNSQAVFKFGPSKYATKAAVARGLESLSEIYQLSTGLLASGVNVILGKYVPVVEGHKYLMSCCWRSLRGEGQYPVDLAKCRQGVKILEEILR